MSTAEMPPDPVDATTKAVTRLLLSISRNPMGSAREVFLNAIHQKGQALHGSAGPEGQAAVIAKIRRQAPDKASGLVRARVVALA